MATERWIFGILYLVACVQTETEEFDEAPDLPADDETETEEFEEAPDLPADDGSSMIMYLLWIITPYIMKAIIV